MKAEVGSPKSEVKAPATLRADVLKQPRLANFRRLLNTRWPGVIWRLVVNHGAKATGDTLEELVPGVFSLNGQLFAVDDVTDIHFCGDEVVVAVERKGARA